MSGEAGGAEAAKALERAGWSEKAETYGLLTGRITARLVEPLLDAVGAARGTRVLDVGCGPGYAARGAAERGAMATGVDIADEMVALARRRNGGIRFLRADAESLPFADGSFDAVVGNLVVNHLPSPENAAREFVRVLRPDGALALSTWDEPERARLMGILPEAVDASGVDRRAAGGSEPFRLADENEFRGLLRGAGLQGVEVRSVALSVRVGDPDELWDGLLGGGVRTAGVVMGQAPSTRARIRAHVERLAEAHRVDGQLVIPADAKIACGRKP